MTVDEAIRAARAGCKNSAAQAYLGHIPEAFEVADAIGESAVYALKVQLRYALNNMQQWRGPEAREAKAVILAFIERKD